MRLSHVISGLCTIVWLVVCPTIAVSRANGQPPEQQAAPGEGVVAPPVESGTHVTLEFDLPEEFLAPVKEGSLVVSGFRVGVFKPRNVAPLATIDVRRDQVTVTGRTGRISVERSRLPENYSRRVLRVQTLAGQTASEWSEPTGPLGGTVTTAAAKKTQQPGAAPRKRQGKQLAMADVERHPRLLESFRKVLPPDAKAEELAARFQSVEDLAVAVVLSEQEKIPIDKLSALMLGPPPRRLRASLRAINPALDSRPLVQKARKQSRTLLADRQ